MWTKKQSDRDKHSWLTSWDFASVKSHYWTILTRFSNISAKNFRIKKKSPTIHSLYQQNSWVKNYFKQLRKVCEDAHEVSKDGVRFSCLERWDRMCPLGITSLILVICSVSWTSASEKSLTDGIAGNFKWKPQVSWTKEPWKECINWGLVRGGGGWG